MKTNSIMTGARSTGRYWVAAAIFGMACVGRSYAADPVFTVAKENADVESSFTLDFGVFGGESVGQISRTDLVMKLQFEAVPGTSQFLAYEQDVASLTLPGGIETGAIRVEIVQSNNVSFDFDPMTRSGEFTTDDIYAVHFEGDLSPFGIVSPFVLPSMSTGTLIFDDGSDTTGRIEMQWEGEGLIGQPPNAIPFFYTCLVHTLFVVPGTADFDGDADVDLTDFGFFQGCFAGEGQQYVAPICELADFDRDGDVGISDYPVYHNHVTGAQ